MKSTDFLTERILNLHDAPAKLKFGQEVWDLLQLSYSKVPGGFGTADSLDDLISKTGLWKIVTRDGVITAVNLYRDQYGRKSVAVGTNGSRQGIKDYVMVKGEDDKFGRAWAEVSGKPELTMQKSGAIPIPAKFAPMLTKKEIIEYNPDGVHYTRMIGGEPHEKIIYGSVYITQQDADRMASFGITLHDLPENIKIKG